MSMTQDDRKEYLYQVDGTMEIHTPTDYSADDEDIDPDNNVHKTQRKICAPADTVRKYMTKLRQVQLLKNQQEKESKSTNSRKQTIIIKPEHISLKHSQKIKGIILMILIPNHRSLKVKHLTLIKLRIPKRVKEPLEHIMIIGCQMILNWTWPIETKISC